MNKILHLFLFSGLMFISCSKKDPINPDKFNPSIELHELKYYVDSVKLTWSKVDHKLFKEYEIYRYTYYSPYKPGEIYISHGELIATINDRNTTTFTDKIEQYENYGYSIRVQISNSSRVYDNLFSNDRFLFDRDLFALAIDPVDILHDSDKDYLYFIEESGRISIYDYTRKKLVKSIHHRHAIYFHNTIAEHSNRKELHIISGTDSLYIYDAYSLELVDQMYLSYDPMSLVYNDGKLYISFAPHGYQPIRIYDRNTGKLIDKTNSYVGYGKLFKIPNVNFELLEISSYSAYHYVFSENDITIRKSDTINRKNALNKDIAAIFPSGNNFISSELGAVYNKKLELETYLSKDTIKYSCFGFINSEYIIGGRSDKTCIEKYSITDFSHVSSINTAGFPRYAFYDSNIVCVSNQKFGYSGNQLVIELLDD